MTGLEPNNLLSVEEEKDDDEETYVALEDINVGEEFLMDYSVFHNSHHTLHLV